MKRRRHPNLPPLPQPGDGSPKSEALAIIKRIHAEGGNPPPEGYVRSPGYISRGPGAVVVERNGEIKFRIPGKAGADLDRMPLEVELDRALQRFEAEKNKISRDVRFILNRQSATNKAAQINRQKGSETEEMILSLARHHPSMGRNLASFIAGRLRLTSQYVRRVLRKANLS